MVSPHGRPALAPGGDGQLPRHGPIEEIGFQCKRESCARYHVGRHHNLSLDSLRPKRNLSNQSTGQLAPYR